MAVLPVQQPTQRWQCGTPERRMQSFASDDVEGTLALHWTLLDTCEWIRRDASKWHRGGSNHVGAESGTERGPVGALARRIEL